MKSYQGKSIALLTQHGKERVIAPVLEPALGCTIRHVTGFDTDQLGTFTREIDRPGTQLDAARRKARVGMQLSGLDYGLASEGSFGVDPFAGMFPWNVEMLVFIDDQQELEIVGIAQGYAHCAHLLTQDWSAAEDFARAQDFPSHQLVLRPEDQYDLRAVKGIADWDSLRHHFEQCQSMAKNKHVFIESDLRAHANPSRMRNIEQATRDLLNRLESKCPKCRAPGYWINERQPGLPCMECGSPTSIFQYQVWHCGKCSHKERELRSDRKFAEARYCDHCNP